MQGVEVVKSAAPGVHHQECSYPVRHSSSFTLINGGQEDEKSEQSVCFFSSLAFPSLLRSRRHNNVFQKKQFVQARTLGTAETMSVRACMSACLCVCPPAGSASLSVHPSRHGVLRRP